MSSQLYQSMAQLPVVNQLLPQDYIITRGANGEYCLDAATEQKLQKQRQFAMYIGGPAVVLAGINSQGGILFKTFIVALGVACTLTHAAHYNAVKTS